MFDLDLLNLNGWSDVAASAVSPYAIRTEGLDMRGPERQYRWSESDVSDGASLMGDAPMKMVERTVPVMIRPRFSSALTNVLTNPRPYSVVTGWATQGSGSTVTYTTANFEPVISAVTTGSANSGCKHEFTGTVAAYSAGVWVRVASGTAPVDVKFDGETATSGTATTTWQLFKTENKTLTAATRSLQVLQTDTGSRTIYVKLACVHLGSTFAGYFDGACGDAKWNSTAHASTSTAFTGQDAINHAAGQLAAKGEKAVALLAYGGVDLHWMPQGATYRNLMSCRAVDVSKVEYDTYAAARLIASCEVTLTCHPYMKGPEYTAGTANKAIGTNELEMTVTGVKGHVAGPARVVITQGSNKNVNFAAYGIQARNYSSGNALTLAATAMGTSGYSGSSTSAQTCVQTLTKSGTISGGTWSLGWEGFTFNASFAHNAAVATVQSAVDAQLGAGKITVGGNPLSTGNMTFTFADTLASESIPALVFASSLTGGGSVTLSTTTTGRPAYISAGLYDDWTTICDLGNLTHTGSYRVLARVYDGSSTSDLYKVNLRLRWGVGGLANLETNDAVIPQAVGEYSVVDLGQIHIPTAATGTQRWNGLIEGKTSGTAGSSVRIVRLAFVPMELGVGEVRSVSAGSSSTLSLFDNFSGASGALAGDTSTSSHTWAHLGSPGDTDDFQAASGDAVTRTAVSDGSSNPKDGRANVLGSTTFTDCSVSVTVQATSTRAYQGVVARATDGNNFLMGGFFYDGTSTEYAVIKVVAGSFTTIGYSKPGVTVPSGVSREVELTAWASGAFRLTINGQTLIAGTDAALATSGTLESGKAGIYDWYWGASANTRTYTDFTASAIAPQAPAIYAGQDLEFRPDGVLREVSAGSVYEPPAIASQPFQPKLLPAGAEGLTNRLLIRTSRNNPDQAGDPLIDAFTATIYHTPVYAVLGRDES